MTVTRKRSQIGKAQRLRSHGAFPLLWTALRMGKLPKRNRRASEAESGKPLTCISRWIRG